MSLSDRIEIWFSFAQDDLTVVLIFMALTLFGFGLNKLFEYTDSMQADYSHLTASAPLDTISYKVLYGPCGYDDAIPSINGVVYDFRFRANDMVFKRSSFMLRINRRLLYLIETNYKDSLEVKYNPENPRASMVFRKIAP